MARPAHETKHIQLLSYPFNDITFELDQRDDGHSNGTALWLGAQCLTALLADTLKTPKHIRAVVNDIALRPRAIELGSGVGLTALALASLGWDVLATDISHVVDTVLRPNIARNAHALPGTLQVRELDWNALPHTWLWDNPSSITHAPSTDQTSDPKQPQRTDLISPPFDLIITSDTLYSPDLVTPLLRSLNHLCRVSISNDNKHPLVYLAAEKRDPALVDQFFEEAKLHWSFSCTRIPHRRITRAMEKGRLKWDRTEWEGLEVWKLQLLSPQPGDAGATESSGANFIQ